MTGDGSYIGELDALLTILEKRPIYTDDTGMDLAGSRFFITGGTGFLGLALVATLLRANCVHNLRLSITILSRDPEHFAQECPTVASDAAVRLVSGDVRSFVYPDGDFTHVIHAASDTSAAADARPLELVSTIVEGSERVLEFARLRGAQRFLFLSSGAVYGPQPAGLDRLDEGYRGAPPTDDPGSAYGQAKRMAELLCTLYHAGSGLNTKIARCFSFVGPHMHIDGHFAIGNFIADAVAGRTIRVKGDGTAIRSYLYVDDAARWLLRILIAGRSGGVYNVGSDEPITIGDLAKRVAALTPIARSFRVEGKPSAPGPRHRYVPDVTRARNELGLEIRTDLDQAIRRTAHWLATHEEPS